jgi:hypothetical protein
MALSCSPSTVTPTRNAPTAPIPVQIVYAVPRGSCAWPPTADRSWRSWPRW